MCLFYAFLRFIRIMNYRDRYSMVHFRIQRYSEVFMKRILIHIPIELYGEYDIFSQHDNEAFVNVIKNKYAGVCPNVGNRLWFQGIISAIQHDENTLDYWSPSMSKDYINQTYDLIVAPMANIFSVGFVSLQETLAERFKGIRIPIYVIACGIQASNYAEIDDICKHLKASATNFISSVYDTGGEFALRGYFTKEFFDRLGYHTAVVTGCPSLYQLGRGLQITNEKVDRDRFLPVLNGTIRDYIKYMSDYPKAVFVDQDIFWKEVIDPLCFDHELADNHHIRNLVKKYGYHTAEYLLDNRIRLFPDMNSWRQFIQSNHFSCSFGSRIHGNIMPLLAGIPAILECRDARTQEMAEFFKIPFVSPDKRHHSLYDLYLDADYSEFNRCFPKRYDYFETFLRKCGIVEHVNTNNEFFSKSETCCDVIINEKKKETLLHELLQKSLYWKSYSSLLDMKRKLLNA